jgi:hypothetical protein
MAAINNALNIDMSAGKPEPRQHGEEVTKDDPLKTPAAGGAPDQLTEADQQQLISVVRQYKQSWFLRRRMILRRILKAYEFFKGNHFISFDPESFQWFDALDAMFSQQAGAENEDLDLYQFATNFYQMFGFAFVSALSTQLPKTQFLPENAEEEEDIATAKASSRIQEIIQRQNKIKSLHKQGLLFLWMAGSYFRHVRYVVDADRAGTHKEPVIKLKTQIIFPDRFICPGCASLVPIDGKKVDQAGMRCPNCGTQMGGNDFYPAEEAELPSVEGSEDVPNGMVAHTLYSALMVDAAPWAKTLSETPILSVEEEVDLAALREMFPGKWKELATSLGPINADNQMERQMRQYVYSESGSRSNFIQDMQPTLSRTWIQPFALNKIDDQATAKKLRRLFPKGLLLINVGDLFLSATSAKLTEEWTWAGTVEEIFGLFPPAVGDAAIPVQDRINDVANIVHEYMDRIACGMVLYNSNLIDGESLDGTPFVPGRLTGLKMKQVASAQGNKLEDAIVQIKAEIDSAMYTYQEKLVFTAQMLVGTPPQIYGGSGDPNIQTKGGQEQQLTTAMGKLGLFWDNIRQENADAAELSVKCAARNMTDDWISVVTDESKQYRNNYVRLDEMKGNVHAYPETDQGFPMTYAEIKAFWEKLIMANESGKNPYINAIMDEPENQEEIATWTATPGMIVPGRDMRNKVLQQIDKLMQGKPIRTTVPIPGGQPGQPPMAKQIMMPSVMPNRELDELDVTVKTVKRWAQKYWEKEQENPNGWQNLLSYYRLAYQWGMEEAQKKQAAQGPPPQGGQPQLPQGGAQ